ncbi:ferrous iron transport protein B [Desulfurispirillum indicum S5]|uniref:Ferrous iron transport protein B n=1 Tax=Desulfurispirillum indicum (strain ATCC BAA-1389 / DSM 22839 / S5) TaxID=653733 RepID=E6W166_DESIS|nr:ferrous iron transport protein B [Desulfurispirillum indicum]ADU66486.1 ferrous iron transport protein B [Desulfurispirillum indicum S5]
MKRSPVFALAGNPNAGKSTLFNTITGARQHVANYPGVTVDTLEGVIDFQKNTLRIVDLPGTYSLSAYSQEELVARRFLVRQKPDAVLNVLDAGSLERHLYLTVQFLELGVPVVLALNMMDEVRKRGISIDIERLSSLLGMPVVATVARTGEGKDQLLQEALALQNRAWEPLVFSYGPDIDPVLEVMISIIEENAFLTSHYPARWVALKYLESDSALMDEGLRINSAIDTQLKSLVAQLAHHCQKTLLASPEELIADYRYGYITGLLKGGVINRDASRRERMDISQRIDTVLTHALLGPIIMLGVLYGLYKATFALGEIPMGWIEDIFGWLGETVGASVPDGLLQSLLVSGIIDGVGGVLVFVPLILIIFLLLSFLEDSGYVARMAYMLDRVFQYFGLHGCSVLPLIISGGIAGGCAVPGIMATRALRSPKEKLATLAVAPFMTCGAKIPVMLMVVAAFFPQHGAAVMFGVTLFAWVMALLVARLLRSTIIAGDPTPFVMELPPYRMPTLQGVLIHTLDRVWAYVKKAGTVILAVAILLWAAMTFPLLPKEVTADFEMQRSSVEQTFANHSSLSDLLLEIDNVEAEAALRNSLAGRMGTALEPLTSLAGFEWRSNIALIGGFAAKEVIVSTMGTAYSLGDVDPDSAASLSGRLASDPHWGTANAISLMIFVLLYAPCMVTVIVMARESSWRWALFVLAFNTILAFSLAIAFYQVASRLF